MATFSILRFTLIFVLSSALTIGQGSAKSTKEETCEDVPHILVPSKNELLPIDRALFKDDKKEQHVSVANIPGGESVNLKYVENFLSTKEIQKLITFCDSRDGWTASPQNYGGEDVEIRRTRTSSSCPLIWPLLYLPKMEMLKSSGRLTPSIEEEINFSWDLMQRIARFLDVDEGNIEPLQIIRYEPGQLYREHHDHGSYYGEQSGQRPVTFLVYLSTMPVSDGGGHTKFKNLDIAIRPRAGDGIIWSNEDSNGKVIDDAIHEAMPPKGDAGDVVKYAMNVWVARDPIMENLDAASYRT